MENRLPILEEYLKELSKDLMNESGGVLKNITPFGFMKQILDDVEVLLTETEKEVN